MHYVYVVRCADGTLYTGYARDPEARVKAHNDGRGAKYTRGRRPVALVYWERFRSKGKALSREHQLKRLNRSDKERLVSAAKRPETGWHALLVPAPPARPAPPAPPAPPALRRA